MRTRSLTFRLLVPATLVLLVGALGALQYHWLGQVSAAEREQLQRSLNQRAREFADDFDREISALYAHVQSESGALGREDWKTFATRLDTWKERAKFPEMVRGVYYARGLKDGHELLKLDPAARRFDAATWPAHLAPVQRQLAGSVQQMPMPPGAKTQVFTVGLSPVSETIPALVIPAAGPPHRIDAAPDVMVSLHLRSSYAIVDLDRAYLTETMLPALVARHFPEPGSDALKVAVVMGAAADTLYARGLPSSGSLNAASADASASFFVLRGDVLRDLAEGRAINFRSIMTSTAFGAGGVVLPRTGPAGAAKGVEGAGAAAGAKGSMVMRPTVPRDGTFSVMIEQRPGTATPARTAPVTMSGWRVLLQHSAGSLDAAVTRARHRNLWLSFGILSLLASAVVLVVVNAQRSQRLAAQQMDFVATVSHELRTPLAVIRSAAQNLAAGVVSEPAQARRYGELIESEGRQLTDMVEQVLEYAGLSGQRRAAPAQPIDVATIARDAIAACEGALDTSGLTIELSAPDAGRHTLVAAGDEGAVRRAVANLITNAVKYGAEGRWIGVGVRRSRTAGRDEVDVSVSDRGRGIEADDLPHIFEPFYRGRYAMDRQIHGNGLGLSLVRRIAEAHGGRVSVASSPGAGATFTLHLPAAPDTVVTPVPAPAIDSAR